MTDPRDGHSTVAARWCSLTVSRLLQMLVVGVVAVCIGFSIGATYKESQKYKPAILDLSGQFKRSKAAAAGLGSGSVQATQDPGGNSTQHTIQAGSAPSIQKQDKQLVEEQQKQNATIHQHMKEQQEEVSKQQQEQKKQKGEDQKHQWKIKQQQQVIADQQQQLEKLQHQLEEQEQLVIQQKQQLDQKLKQGEQQQPQGVAPAPQQQEGPKPQISPGELHHRGYAGAACKNMDGRTITLDAKDKRLISPLVIVAHNRVGYLIKTAMQLLKHWLEDESYAYKFPLFISIDGEDERALLSAISLHQGAGVQVIQNLRNDAPCGGTGGNIGYCRLSLHYKMLLQLFFDCLKAPRLIFLEEDLQIAPDFFTYFQATAPLLEQDKSLWCISAWNGHGQRGRASNSTALYRTDVMPGLGWMLSAEIGKELWPQWPAWYWDDWMREPHTRKGRQCVFPEVPRTHTFGEMGTSNGMFYEAHLKPMLLNKEEVPWLEMDLSYLKQPAYNKTMQAWLAAAKPLPEGTDLAAKCAVTQPDAAATGDLSVMYDSDEQYQQIALALKPMLGDLRGGRPRCSYEGIVMVRCRGQRLFIAPRRSGSPTPAAPTPQDGGLVNAAAGGAGAAATDWEEDYYPDNNDDGQATVAGGTAAVAGANATVAAAAATPDQKEKNTTAKAATGSPAVSGNGGGGGAAAAAAKDSAAGAGAAAADEEDYYPDNIDEWQAAVASGIAAAVAGANATVAGANATNAAVAAPPGQEAKGKTVEAATGARRLSHVLLQKYNRLG